MALDFVLQRDAGRCKVLRKKCQTHREAAVRNPLRVVADGNSRNRVRMSLESKRTDCFQVGE